MSKNSRTEKAIVTESADFGAYFLILAVVAVGAPFSLGLGFFAFDKGFEMLNDYKENKRKEDEEEEKNNNQN